MQAFISNELNFGLQISSDRPHWYGHNIKRLFEKAPDIDVELNKSKEAYNRLSGIRPTQNLICDEDLPFSICVVKNGIQVQRRVGDRWVSTMVLPNLPVALDRVWMVLTLRALQSVPRTDTFLLECLESSYTLTWQICAKCSELFETNQQYGVDSTWLTTRSSVAVDSTS
jgi:hypothetical protein